MADGHEADRQHCEVPVGEIGVGWEWVGLVDMVHR